MQPAASGTGRGCRPSASLCQRPAIPSSVGVGRNGRLVRVGPGNMNTAALPMNTNAKIVTSHPATVAFQRKKYKKKNKVRGGHFYINGGRRAYRSGGDWRKGGAVHLGRPPLPAANKRCLARVGIESQTNTVERLIDALSMYRPDRPVESPLHTMEDGPAVVNDERLVVRRLIRARMLLLQT